MAPNPQFYHLTVESAKKRTLIIDSDMFIRFFYFLVVFCGFFEVFDLLLGLKVPPWFPYGLIPIILCIPTATNQNTDFVCEFGSFFSFSQIVMLLGLIFGHFWPPTVPQTRPRVPIWTLTPESNPWPWNQPKNWPSLLIDMFFRFFYFFCRFLRVFWGFWPPPEAQSTPMVSIWADTPKFMYSHGS